MIVTSLSKGGGSLMTAQIINGTEIAKQKKELK